MPPLCYFALVLCLGTAAIVGLFPAWRHSGAAPLAGLHDRSWSATATYSSARARKLLVAAQLAAVVVLLTAAGLFIRSFTALLRLDLGFDARGVLTFNLDFSEEKYDTKEKQWALIDAVLDSAQRLPGAVAAGAVYQRPFAHGAIGMDSSVIIEGQPLAAESSSRNPILNWEVATPDYFRAMDIRLLRGRLFDEGDSATSPLVVIVGQSLAAQLWPGQDPLGKRVLVHGAPGDENSPGWQTVVSVVEDARYREIEALRFDSYLPYRQAPNHVQHFMVRLTGDPLAAVPALRTAVAALDPEARDGGDRRPGIRAVAVQQHGCFYVRDHRVGVRGGWNSGTRGFRGDATNARDRRPSRARSTEPRCRRARRQRRCGNCAGRTSDWRPRRLDPATIG